jgi:hypothetical protein
MDPRYFNAVNPAPQIPAIRASCSNLWRFWPAVTNMGIYFVIAWEKTS